MPGTMGGDDGEDVQDFLKRIRELGDQRDREDEERTRKLEQEIIQGRKERQARREERARSLSPSKDTAASSTTSSTMSRNQRTVLENMDNTTSLTPPPSTRSFPNENAEPRKTAVPTTNGRPQDRSPFPERFPSSQKSDHASTDADVHDVNSRYRHQQPSSRMTTSTENTPSSPAREGGTGTEEYVARSTVKSQEEASRADIAQSLGAKDPAWFRQTAERGLGSAAYRRPQDEDRSTAISRGSNVGLPGMSKDKSDVKSSDPNVQRTASPGLSTKYSPSEPAQNGGSSLPSASSSVRSPMPSSSSQRLDPPSAASSISGDRPVPVTRNYAMSPSQRGISPERVDRPPSPTKGLGGFVQSAMMKRSDSVSKRWSTQPPASLVRPDSVASNRSGYEPKGMGGLSSLGEPRPVEASPESRPVSSHSRPTPERSDSSITPQQTSSETLSGPGDQRDSTGLASSVNTQSRPSSKDSNPENITSPPASPSKRWSPQKSSWLEKAISKPESPKVMSPAPASQQPSWMADIARAKQQRGSVDIPKGPVHKEIVTPGLMRAPPPATGFKPPTMTGVGAGPRNRGSSSLRTSDDLDFSQTSGNSLKSSLPASRSLGRIPSNETNTSGITPKDERASVKAEEDDLSPALQRASSPSAKPTTSPPVKSKPEFARPENTKPAIGSSPSTTTTKREGEPEFKNIFGNLKPTRTQKYKAPDELKDNIVRGKAGLNLTGGPKKTDLKDEFRESILKKKQAMVAPSASTKISGAAMSNADANVPEALRRRQDMKRSDSINGVKSPVAKQVEKEELQPSAAKAPLTDQTFMRPKGEVQPPRQPKPKEGLGIDFASSLSGILQRGPPPVNKDIKEFPQSLPTVERSLDKQRSQTDPSSNSSQQLTHATKGRARGPKRKPPAKAQTSDKAESPAATSSPTVSSQGPPLKAVRSAPDNDITESKHQTPEPRPLQNITNSNNNTRRGSQPPAPRKPSSSVPQSPKIPSTVEQESIGNNRSPKVSAFPATKQIEDTASHKAVGSSSPHIPTLAKTPISKPQAPAPANTKENVSSIAKSTKGPRSPPLPQKPKTFSQPSTARDTPRPFSPAVNKTSSRHLDVASLLSSVFDDVPGTKAAIKLDTQRALDEASSTSSFPKIKTLRKQIFEIAENGKSVPVPSHQEHILFDESLYLCSHVFGTPTGQRMTEVYLWCGDNVSLSAIDDAQVFAKRHARESGGPLIILQQGKETSSFFQALGGIVMIRNGSSKPGNSARAAGYMLRGRQHIGQVSFDEPELIPSNLCSGFPHILSSETGKLYLWKGKGASADEVGCARLIGMDLGDIEEVDEGSEPQGFWSSVFGTSGRQVSETTSPHWHLKSSCDKFTLRLFSISIETPRPKSASSFMQWGRRGSAPSNPEPATMQAVVKEIVPFSQTDGLDEGVMVLDAFFEVFVIQTVQSLHPSPQHRSQQSTPFRAALLFAQEYAILAASAEDRPLVPQAKVVLFSRSAEEANDAVPEALICAFRKWDPTKFDACRVVPLPECLEAFGVSREA